MLSLGQRRLASLKQTELFSDFGEEELGDIERLARLVVVRKGAPLFLPGDRPNSLYQLKTGRMKICRLSEEGKEFIVDLIEPGDIFGEMSILGGDPEDTTAVALEDSRILVIARSQFEELLRRKPVLALKAARLISLRRKELESRLETLVFKRVAGRLANLLLQLSRRYGVPDRRGTLLRIRLSQQEMGNLIGASRELVSLTLSDFRRQGWIDQDCRRLIIRQQEYLQRL